jgi:quinol-cytochrome oxidoreductase complex cytochrome b subunit
MLKKISRPVTKWEILFAVIIMAALIVGGYIGYTYPGHPILGKSRAVFLFLIVSCLILKAIEKWAGLYKKIKKEIEKKEKVTTRD